MAILFDLPELTMLLYRLTLNGTKFREKKGSDQLTQSEWETVAGLLGDLLLYCRKVGFEKGEHKAGALISYMNRDLERYVASVVAVEIANMHSEIMGDVLERKFVSVAKDLSTFLDMPHPMGEEVAEAFPSATDDLKEAGNCLALGCNPAVAYHLMRAAEVGLWELGRDRQIPCAGKIEFTEWGLIIRELETAVISIQQWANSKAKEDAHKFYNASLVEIRAFNDGWRRHSAHARPHMPKMESDEAIALWGHVSRFMNKLATKIREGSYTPLVWI